MAEKFAVLIKYKYLEYIESAKLSDADAWTFMKGIIEYDKTGTEPVYSNPVLSGLFAVVKIDLDTNKENYEAVSQARSEAGKEGAKKRWEKEGKGKNSKSHEDIAKMANANGNSNCHDSQKNMAKMHDLDSDLGIVSENGKENRTPKQKSQKPPLREREPVNDMERVEKAYRLNWDTLYSRKRVETPDPILNWKQTRKQLKTHFEKLKPEQIIQAINNGLNDEWVLDKGYSLAIMLSASVLNRLINAAQKESWASKNQQSKKSLE